MAKQTKKPSHNRRKPKLVRGVGPTSGAAKQGRTAPVAAAGPVAAGAAAFPIVGIGASAGGLEALSQLLALIPADSGMAFVLIQHLDPTHKSYLREALSRATRMPVTEVQQGERVQPNHVYVIPPASDVAVERGLLKLTSRAQEIPRLHLPVDTFLTALAAERGRQAIGVVLSGTGSDGTEGLKAIKAEGGITFAQDPHTAKFSGMPGSAIGAGVVDCALPLSDLAKELVRLSCHPYVAAPAVSLRRSPPKGGDKTNEKADGTVLARIMNVVKAAVGVDFREYKTPTFERRLARRMALRRLDSREGYLDLLMRDPLEVRALCEDALIHVSSFFRDPEVFETLVSDAFPEILKHKPEGAPLRIWVAGCSTGQEAYSLALCLLEFLGDSPHPHPVQIFASDISEQAIQTARAGRYSDGAMRGVSEERRRRYFTKMENGYRINKTVRDLCVFVRHDLARDPPFSKLDLLSCRNVLIYFDPTLQKRVLPMFHYALNVPGFLLLGRTEHVAGFDQLFASVDKASKIFARTAGQSTLRFASRSDTHPTRAQTIAVDERIEWPRRSADVGRHLDNLLLARYAPPGVLVNDRMEVLQFRGQTGSYLQPAPGEPRNNIVSMARGGLLSKLRTTIARARKERAPIRTEGVEVDQNGFTRTCDLVVLPFTGLPDVKDQLFVVLFEETSPNGKSLRRGRGLKRRRGGTVKEAQRIPQLEHELSATTEYLHSLIEEQSRTNDDLGSANEELVSGNEELQSLNEELETAKEELQSTNEELTTVNDELHNRNLEATRINSDLANLVDTVDIPVVIVDKERRIRRFTPRAQNLLNVLPSDLGRLFDNIKPQIEVPDLDRQIAGVIATFAAKESEVKDRDGRWYRLQIRPYKTAEGAVDGAIVSLFDIDALKHHIHEAQQARDEAERADHAKDQFLAVLSHELRTPLTSLLIQTQLLREVGGEIVKRERACDAIERSTRMQVQLVDDLLDVSRIVTGKMKVTQDPLNFAAVVKATLDSMGAFADSKGIELRTSLDESSGSVLGDRTRLEQVVTNLVANAIKFTPRGGRVKVVMEKANGEVHLRVSDNGIGIDPRFLPRIFDRLTQKDGSATRPHGGLGLGLAIVRHLVDAHGGTVRAESAGPGQGATFHVTLPLLQERLPSTASTAIGPAASGIRQASPPGEQEVGKRLSGRRILVVDDDANTREAIAEMFTRAGAAVRTAESAAEGLTTVEEFRPHVMVCDIAMPGDDGYSFIRRVRALGLERGGETPALALTALAGEANRLRALAEGFQMHLSKPVEIGRLAAAVAEVLEGTAGVTSRRPDQPSTA